MKKKKENEKQKIDTSRSMEFHHPLSHDSGEGGPEFWGSPKTVVSPAKEAYGTINMPQYPQHAHPFYFNNNSFDMNYG